MFPLAWNEQAEPIAPPEGAVAFRVRRIAGGRPAVVYADDGAPLRVPLTCQGAELFDLVGKKPGRYRLDFVDEDGALVVQDAPGEDGEPIPAPYCITNLRDQGADKPDADTGMHRVLQMQNELLQQVFERSAQVQEQMLQRSVQVQEKLVSQIGAIMDASAKLVRAADGAGIPQRYEPGAAAQAEQLRAALAMSRPGDAVEGGEEVPAWAVAVEALANQTLPVVKHLVNTKVLGLDDSQSLQLLGASPQLSIAATTASPAPATPPVAAPTTAQPAPSNGVAAVKDAVSKVLERLSEPERQQADKMLGALPEAVRTQVVAAISTMPVDDAVAAVRSKLKGQDSS